MTKLHPPASPEEELPQPPPSCENLLAPATPQGIRPPLNSTLDRGNSPFFDGWDLTSGAEDKNGALFHQMILLAIISCSCIL